tara:strand:- start:952 stop:1365 length:414 start_codon:yes stop_codon:yes gene_type:complete
MAQKAGIIVDDWMYVLVDTVKYTHITSCTLTVGVESIDLTSYDSNRWKDITVGDRNWSISLEAHYAMDAAETIDDQIDEIIAGTSSVLLFGNVNSGDTTFGGTGFCTSVSLNSSKGSSTTISATWEGTGALAISTVA